MNVNCQLMPATAGAKLVYTSADGHYVGSVTFDAVSPQALGVLGRMFSEWCVQQTGSIQVATAVNGARQ